MADDGALLYSLGLDTSAFSGSLRSAMSEIHAFKMTDLDVARFDLEFAAAGNSISAYHNRLEEAIQSTEAMSSSSMSLSAVLSTITSVINGNVVGAARSGTTALVNMGMAGAWAHLRLGAF